jgi:hypothetical protein
MVFWDTRFARAYVQGIVDPTLFMNAFPESLL